MMMPKIPAPPDRQFTVWAHRFSDPLIERALWRTSKKFGSSSTVVPVIVHKYVTGLLLNLEKEHKT
jgi:hypothetical protein